MHRSDVTSLEILFVGLATVDTIVELPRWPEPDGRLVAEGLHSAGGGPAATAAVAAARLGRRVSICGAIGADPAGVRVRDELAAAGVDVSLLVRRPGDTPQSVILLDASDGTRSILHVPGATLDALPPPALDAAADAAWVHVDHVGWALVSGLAHDRISVDAGNPIDGLELDGIGLYVPTGSALQARYRDRGLGAAIEAALDEGAQRVAVTLGGSGAVAADDGGAWRVGPVAVDVRSTLGAGDVFHGALLAALVAGEALPDALRTANLAAALSCRGLDGRTAIPTADELGRHLAAAPAVEPILLDELE